MDPARLSPAPGGDPPRNDPAASSRPAPQPLLPSSALESRYAGLLFLLNAFVALGLYPDFTRPRGPGLAPSPLWLADRIGRRWFGSAYARDPLSRWIGRNGCAGPLPRDWRADPPWLNGFDKAAAPRLLCRHRRTTLWHPAGFPIADGPEAMPERLRRCARACGYARRPGTAHRSAPKLPRTLADRWIACLAFYLDARIRAASGDPCSGLAALALPGRIEIADLDVTAHFRLDAHPIALRIAGLDRDPGWQPAEGRAIGFRFE